MYLKRKESLKRLNNMLIQEMQGNKSHERFTKSTLQGGIGNNVDQIIHSPQGDRD